MKDVFKDYLFTKGYFVSDPAEPQHSAEYTFNALVGLGKLFNIVIDKNANLATVDMLHIAETGIGTVSVPAPFYIGFPSSVRELTKDQLLLDQLYSYFITYGLNDFEGEGTRSIFEEQIERGVLDEKTEVKHFEILTEKQAHDKLRSCVDDLLSSTRPLSKSQYDLVKQYIVDYSYAPTSIASKNTAIKLLNDIRDLELTSFLCLPDIIKLVEEMIQAEKPDSSYMFRDKSKLPKLTKLNLPNRDRKFITAVIRRVIEKQLVNLTGHQYRVTHNQVIECLEKRKLWKGLLHHIHFNPQTDLESYFVSIIYNDDIKSKMSYVEKYIAQGDIKSACVILTHAKGATAVLRHMNYLLSRCNNEEDKKYVIDTAFTSNAAVALIQQLYNYSYYNVDNRNARHFKFTHQNLLKTHTEEQWEVNKRRSYITEKDKQLILSALENKLQTLLKGRLNKVYIDEGMNLKAVPIQETAGNSGYGVLSRGSRVHLDGRTVRLFTYWEKVNDIDLSVMGIDDKGNLIEFSWRTFYNNQNDAICFSGDQTRGYEGGSEYIDVSLDKFKSRYPNIKYLVVCDNVYSGTPFNSCTCTAGYMLREKVDSGEVFEPKTVKSSFLVQGDTTFSYLFAIDIDANDFVWLNVNKDSNATVAGTTDFDFLISYIESTNVLNLQSLFTYMATEVVDNMGDADIIVTDKVLKGIGNGQTIIHSNDVEKIMSLIQ